MNREFRRGTKLTEYVTYKRKQCNAPLYKSSSKFESGSGWTTFDQEVTGAVSLKREVAIFAGGCFWGVEHLFKNKWGVLSAVSGYTGGDVPDPTYYQVCSGNTGHAEAVEVVFDANQISYKELTKYFLEIHDPSQKNRQGPDIGSQYRSEIFYTDESQKTEALRLLSDLKEKGYTITTKITKASVFYPAEQYHQEYYTKRGGQPYCHSYVKRF